MINRYLFVSSLILILTLCAMGDTVARMHGAGVLSPAGVFDILGLSFVVGLAMIAGIGALVTKR